MIILIDSGNTRVKIGWIAADPGAGVAADPDAGVTADAIANVGADRPAATASGQPIVVRDATAFDNGDDQALARWLGALPGKPTQALGANVASADRRDALQSQLAERGCAIRWVVPRAEALGLASRYKNPGQLGPDRWASMLGAMARLRAPRPAFLLACFGTATTLDTVSADGVFEGGLILPGTAMMRKALASGTAALPLADGTAEDFPTDTHQAIASGVAAAQAGALLRQWLAGLRRYGTAPLVFAAGGGWDEVAAETRRLLADAATAMGHLPPQVQVIDNPVLDGLACLAVHHEPPSSP